MNEAGFHICPSEHEGCGHYIHEAKSVGAVVLYTDAGSMNETFEPYVNGISIEYSEIQRRNKYCPKYIVSSKNVEDAANYYLSMSLEEKINMGGLAHRSFLEHDREFKMMFYNIIYNEFFVSLCINYISYLSEYSSNNTKISE